MYIIFSITFTIIEESLILEAITIVIRNGYLSVCYDYTITQQSLISVTEILHTCSSHT